MSLASLAVPVDLDELITTSPIECVRSVETGKLRELLQWIIGQLQMHNGETSTFKERLEELEKWKLADPYAAIGEDVQELKEYKKQSAEELEMHGEMLSELKNSVDDLKTPVEPRVVPEDVNVVSPDSHLDQDDNNLAQDQGPEEVKEANDSVVKQRVRDIEGKIKETEEQVESLEATNSGLEEVLQKPTDEEIPGQVPGHSKVEDSFAEKPDFEAKLQELAGRLEDAESQLQEIRQVEKDRPLLSESFQKMDDGPKQTENLSSNVLDIESHNTDHESTNEIENVVQLTDLGGSTEEEKPAHEEQHIGALETDLKVPVPPLPVGCIRRRSSATQKNILEEVKNQISKLESEFDAFQRQTEANRIVQRLNELEDVQHKLANIEQKLNEKSPSTLNPFVEKSVAKRVMQNASEEVKTEETSGQEEQKPADLQDSDTSATLSQKNSNKDLSNLNSLEARLDDLQQTKADISSLESLEVKLNETRNQILHRINKQAVLVDQKTTLNQKSGVLADPNEKNSAATELKTRVEDLQKSFETLLQSLKQINPKAIELLENKVKKLSSFVQKLKEQKQEQHNVCKITPYGDHAMLSAKPVLGYKCMACDRPLEKLDGEQGPYLPSNVLPAPRSKSCNAFAVQNSDYSNPSLGEMSLRSPRGATKTLVCEDSNRGPILPKGGWKTHGNYRAKLKSRLRSRRNPASTRAPEPSTA